MNCYTALLASNCVGLLGDAAPHRIGAGTISDMASSICRQAHTYPFLKKRKVLSCHRCKRRPDARRSESCCPEILEIIECPMHSDLPRFNRIQAGTSPQVPHDIYPRRIRAWWNRNSNTKPAYFRKQRLIWETTIHHVPRISGNSTPRTNHPSHFGNALGRVGNEKDH